MFPTVLCEKSTWESLWIETYKHHPYVKLFAVAESAEAEEKRVLIGLHLLTIQTMLMFVLALCYDLQVFIYTHEQLVIFLHCL